MQSQRAMEHEFAQHYKDVVSEWNPCYDEHGRPKSVWDDDLLARAVAGGDEPGCGEAMHCADPRNPERGRLREALGAVLDCEGDPYTVDLEIVRKLPRGPFAQSKGMVRSTPF